MKKAPIIFLAIILIGFGSSLVYLFVLRFEAGDVLPAYSSLRTDPLGAKAFYESLLNLESLSVSRNFGRLDLLDDEFENGSGLTVFFLGTSRWSYVESEVNTIRNLESLVLSGGRLVISFIPQKSGYIGGLTEELAEEKAKKDQEQKDKEQKAEKQDDEKQTVNGGQKEDEKESAIEPEKDKTCPPADGKSKDKDEFRLEKHWGVKLEIDRGQDGPENSRAVTILSRLDPEIPWHSRLYFDSPDKRWRVVYWSAGRPVIIERRFGRGSIVLAADSYLFSNEALAQEPRPNLLSWFIGQFPSGPGRVVFDETHLGLGESPTVAGLIRKYNLHGFILGILVLAGLYFWKNSSSLIPPMDDETDGDETSFSSGRDSASGLVSMLRGNIKSDNILAECFSEWTKSSAAINVSAEKIARIETVVKSAAGQADPVAGYRTVCDILAEGKPWNKA